MKKATTLLLVSFISFGVSAQKVIEKNIEFNGQYIDVELPFASSIEVKTWDKSTVYFKANIQAIEAKYLDLYKLEVSQSDTSIDIASDTKAVFKAFEEDWKKQKLNKKMYGYTIDMYDFNYVLYVPKNATFKLTSINGSMKSEIIEGDFEADLINGDIDIKQYRGNLDLRTINGEIDLKVSNASFVAETIHGNIYADEKLNLKSHDKHVGQKVTSNIANSKNRLELNTINGNMYLRM
ncbi:hypothetical protein [Allomuricauda sp. d1]|uniref:hypothetical protein n=1 Tax=Allomuricauda sp. d1 TaxID=3136725 RepID=UPI0031D68BCF